MFYFKKLGWMRSASGAGRRASKAWVGGSGVALLLAGISAHPAAAACVSTASTLTCAGVIDEPISFRPSTLEPVIVLNEAQVTADENDDPFGTPGEGSFDVGSSSGGGVSDAPSVQFTNAENGSIVSAQNFRDAVYLENPNLVAFDNAGLIRSETDGRNGVRIDVDDNGGGVIRGVNQAGGVIIGAGERSGDEISSFGGFGVSLELFESSASFDNAGRVEGGLLAFSNFVDFDGRIGGESTIEVVNNGSFVGDWELTNTLDSIFNAGDIEAGLLELRDRDDVFVQSADGGFVGLVDAGDDANATDILAFVGGTNPTALDGGDFVNFDRLEIAGGDAAAATTVSLQGVLAVSNDEGPPNGAAALIGGGDYSGAVSSLSASGGGELGAQVVLALDDATLTADDIAVGAGGSISGNGVLDGVVTVEDGGSIAPGLSPGVISITDDLVLRGALEIELAGLLDGEFDRIDIDGDLIIEGGSLEVTLLNGFLPTVGDRFSFLTVTGDIIGIDSLSFSLIGALGVALEAEIEQLANGFSLSLLAADPSDVIPVPGAGLLMLSALSLAGAQRLRRHRQ